MEKHDQQIRDAAFAAVHKGVHEFAHKCMKGDDFDRAYHALVEALIDKVIVLAVALGAEDRAVLSEILREAASDVLTISESDIENITISSTDGGIRIPRQPPAVMAPAASRTW